jgi:hypothetical protein
MGVLFFCFVGCGLQAETERKENPLFYELKKKLESDKYKYFVCNITQTCIPYPVGELAGFYIDQFSYWSRRGIYKAFYKWSPKEKFPDDVKVEERFGAFLKYFVSGDAEEDIKKMAKTLVGTLKKI